jgi:hypothetical protein
VIAEAVGRATAPSGRQLEIAFGEQRAWTVEVGGGLRAYSALGRELRDRYAADEMCSSARGQCVVPGPNRMRDGRYEFAGSSQQLPLTEPGRQCAIHGLARCVNNLAPGAIATPINAATLADPAKVQRLQEIVPLQRMGKPEEVAEVALFLASGRSSYVTGSTYFVDGGIVRHAEAL